MKKIAEIYQKVYGDALVKVILYGSYARGIQVPESDIDIAAIVHGQRIALQRKLREVWGKSPFEVYSILETGSIIDEYIVPCYDVLHTLGAKYLVNNQS